MQLSFKRLKNVLWAPGTSTSAAAAAAGVGLWHRMQSGGMKLFSTFIAACHYSTTANCLKQATTATLCHQPGDRHKLSGC